MGDKHSELLQQGNVSSPIGGKCYSIDELAAMQNVKLIEDVRSLFGIWPGDVNDGFEEWVNKLRKQE